MSNRIGATPQDKGDRTRKQQEQRIVEIDINNDRFKEGETLIEFAHRVTREEGLEKEWVPQECRLAFVTEAVETPPAVLGGKPQIAAVVRPMGHLVLIPASPSA